MNYVAYYRVSTKKQGQSGLGLESQRELVNRFLKHGDVLLQEYVEVESGKRNDRPELEKAITFAKQQQAQLLIAKLDRLSRNAGFIFTLRDSHVNFLAVDMPDANTLTIGIFAVLAQHERELISTRTRAALQQKKLQGFALGTPENLTHGARTKGLQVRQENAASHKANRQATELIQMYREKGMTYQQIADRLNSHGFTTRRGKKFFAITVQRLHIRQGQLQTDALTSPE
ncbi:DNA invertase Pin-like site-specific DNA recombinase [Pontibacter ummariensis]|uniref:Site-specific DNA recombinase n=1 Tax=Pontibacter ummariensis TaxID=1610492 RepID=A0A239JEA6_9BACT|nr:recombinase family protein [Pontibacter ummariensis]PRY08385.1 DNA invertase Pin-like site-specific DNA recombinase [Pontibacter ummariensis]SNT04155.1 Site-specific DNA recombinase [Pontibacter ummariensis]